MELDANGTEYLGVLWYAIADIRYGLYTEAPDSTQEEAEALSLLVNVLRDFSVNSAHARTIQASATI